jgi:hypothetical protein
MARLCFVGNFFEFIDHGGFGGRVFAYFAGRRLVYCQFLRLGKLLDAVANKESDV